MHGHNHPLVVVVDATDELGQVRLDVAQRKHGHDQKYDQKSRPRQTASRPAGAYKSVYKDTKEAGSLFEDGL
jgi:hypothetical protein